jgi:hypothetical protein
LSVGQIATIAWLIKDHAITEEKAGRELLLNCYAAVNPDADWFRYFREGIEKAVGPVQDFVKEGNNSIVLQAARRIAGEESFGYASVVRELNMAEVLALAREEGEAERRRWEAELEEERAGMNARLSEANDLASRQRTEVVREAEVSRREAVRLAREEAEIAIRNEVEQAGAHRAARRAEAAIAMLKWGTLLVFVACLVSSLLFEGSQWLSLPSAVVLLVTIVSFADVLRLGFLAKWREAMRRQFIRFFTRL